jgi:uncharacterized membrane protein
MSLSFFDKIPKCDFFGRKTLFKYAATLLVAFLTLLVLALPWQDAFVVKAMRIFFGSAFILLLPWYWITIAAFKDDEIDTLERIALSFALSVSSVPLLVFYANLFGMRITPFSVFFIACSIIGISAGTHVFHIRWKK